MNYHGWLLSISLVLLWLFCHSGSGIGSDGTDGRAIVNGSGSESPLMEKVTTAAISVSAATTGSSTNTSVSPEAITSSSGTTTSASSSVIERSTVESVGKVYSEDKSTRAFHTRATTELKNDNETVTQAVQSTPPSTTDPSTFPSTSLTASLSIHHSDFATSTKPQQQQQHQHLQQRSKLWAPHSTVADFLKGMDDDAGSNSTENHHISSGNTESSSSSASNSHKTNTNLPNEKLVQQTRSIRSIRLIANNSTSTISIPPLSSQQARDAGRSSRRGNGNTNSNLDGVYHVNNNKFPVISSIRHYRSRKSFSRTHKSTNPNSNLENAGGGRSDIMTSDSGNNLNHEMFTTKSGTYMRTTPTSPIHEKGTKKGKTVKTSLSTNNLSFSQEDDDDKDGETEGEEMKDVHEMPQGDEPPNRVKEAQEQDGATHEGGYYYGRVATRKIFGAKADGNFRSGSSSSPSDISREHYGKVIDKPMLSESQEEQSITSDEEARSGYSSRDDTSAGPHYENPYIITKDAAIITTGGELPYSKKEPAKSTTTTTGKSGSHRFYSEEDKNATILHRINKTFLSRSKLQPQYGSNNDKHVGSSNAKNENGRTISGSSDLLGNRFPDTDQDSIPRFNENNQEQNERENQNPSGRNGKGTSIRLPNDSFRGSTNNSPQSFGTSTTGINISRNHWNPSTSPSFFGTSSLGKDKPKDSVNDSDYAIAESGKSHSLLAFPSPNEKVADVSPQRKQQRNRNGEFNQRQQQKERRKLEGARRPATTDGLHQDHSGSGSLPEGNDFRKDPEYTPNNHRIAEGKRDHLDNQANMDFNRNTDSQTWSSRQSQMRDQVLANDPSSNRHREHENPVGGSSSGDSRPNWRKELNEQGERRTSERKSKSRNSEVNNRQSSDEVNDGDNQVVQEYFPRVESIAGSHSEESSNDNSYNEYRPPEDSWTDIRPRYNSYELPDDVDSASSLSGTELSSSSQRNKPDIDIVTRFLNIVESQHLLGENCSAGTDFNLGEGVVDRYAQERFRLEAEFAVNRANMLTRMWKYVNLTVLENEYLLHAMVMSMVEFDDDIFAAGNCYDQFQYKNYTLFCPFAYRYDWGTVLVKDLSLEYHYLGNNSEWFFIARKNAEKIIQAYDQFNRGEETTRQNMSMELRNNICVSILAEQREHILKRADKAWPENIGALRGKSGGTYIDR
ncbi:unnamed protein product [Orchesella dallaii]|uniref:Uncharacterized protein n=1 Tax=Orchesella dallaii TaxID=48710 RepID=A0ABP1QFI0_9HEXA